MIKLKDLLNEGMNYKALQYFRKELWDVFKYAISKGSRGEAAFYGILKKVAKKSKFYKQSDDNQIELHVKITFTKAFSDGRGKINVELQKKIGDKIREINKLVEISESNQKNIETYKDRIGKQKEGVTDPLFERAVNALRKNNEGIINDFVNKNFKEVPGSALTKAEFKQYVEGVEFLKLLNTYKLESGVPLGAYLKQNL